MNARYSPLDNKTLWLRRELEPMLLVYTSIKSQFAM